MDKKKIYIIIIVICLLATGGILYYGLHNPTPDNIDAPIGFTPTNTNIDAPIDVGQASSGNTIAGVPIPNKTINYSAPKVFPQDVKMDLSVFNTPEFKKLNDYKPLTISPEEIGRPNPFQAY